MFKKSLSLPQDICYQLMPIHVLVGQNNHEI
jgi:hypothetical protein